jgi:hypothetical protein
MAEVQTSQSLPLNYWKKTMEGMQVIQEQKPFCLGGNLFQGYQGAPISIGESQLSDEEMQNVQDIDGTMARQWTIRRQRLESRYSRKMQEYDERRATLRDRRGKIRDGLKSDAETNIPPNPSDLAELERIDARMKRLEDMTTQESMKLAHLRVGEKVEEEVAPVVERHGAICDHCQKESPPAHKNPKMWLKGHLMQCKSAREARK